MFSHFDSLGVLLNAESCFLNKFGCRYSYESLSSVPQKPHYFTERYLDVKKVLVETFYGPPKEGVYSPSVQNTLYLMAKSVLNRSLSLSLSLSLWRAHTNPCPHTCRPTPVSTSMLIYLHPTHTRMQRVRNTYTCTMHMLTLVSRHRCMHAPTYLHLSTYCFFYGAMVLD
jgi:hypothetical protein